MAERKLKYFGTDGFRGEANVGLTSMHAYKIGRFLGWYFARKSHGHRARIVIGKDTRRSSYMLEYSLVAGITASGADAYMLHVTTTPSVSYAVRQNDFDCGVMITASHNPYYDNGIKIINNQGEKLDDDTTFLIEDYIDRPSSEPDLPLAEKDQVGCIVDYVAGRNRYVGYLISVASNSYKDLQIGLDCANGASWTIAKAVFDALGAKVTLIGAEPNGLNINQDCGSTHLEKLQELVKERNLDVGFAFDGDADRCLVVDKTGKVIDGDAIMYILAKHLKSQDMLDNDTVVATVMSNSGFVKSLAENGIKCVQTQVGDRFVYEEMQKNDYSLGGEQSGHVIMKKYATTGDGILTAIMLTEEMCDRKKSLGELTEGLKVFPQYLLNVRVKDKNAVMNDAEVLHAADKVEKSLVGNGRVLLRQSGTEPVIRIMIEADGDCEAYAEQIAKIIKERGYLE